MSALVISGLLGLVTNILTADDKYSLHNSENLGQAIQMQLYKKRKNSQNGLIVTTLKGLKHC